MDFLRIAGNEEILNDWVEYLIRCNVIKSEMVDGKVFYLKTDLGHKLHAVLRDHNYLGPLIGDLSRNRRRSVGNSQTRTQVKNR